MTPTGPLVAPEIAINQLEEDFTAAVREALGEAEKAQCSLCKAGFKKRADGRHEGDDYYKQSWPCNAAAIAALREGRNENC